MARLMEDDFTYFVKIRDEDDKRYYLKSTIDERTMSISIQLTNLKTAWTGTAYKDQVENMARNYPQELEDTFYSHTQRAFSKGNDSASRHYTFAITPIVTSHSQSQHPNKMKFIWKQKIDALATNKFIGGMDLHAQPLETVLTSILDHTLEQIETFRQAEVDAKFEVQRIREQHTIALKTVEETVQLKKDLEADFYRKFGEVLDKKKEKLRACQRRVEELEAQLAQRGPLNGNYNNASDNEAMSGGETDDSNDGFSERLRGAKRSRSPAPATTTSRLNDLSPGPRRQMDTDESGTEDEDEREPPTGVAPHPPVLLRRAMPLMDDNREELSLGDDDDTLPKPNALASSYHYQKRKYVNNVNTISTQVQNNTAGAGAPPESVSKIHPSLQESMPDEDELLNRL